MSRTARWEARELLCSPRADGHGVRLELRWEASWRQAVHKNGVPLERRRFLFQRDGVLYRQVNSRYRPEYDALMASGLYAALVKAGCLVEHEEVDARPGAPQEAYKVIRPTRLPFISYPYEWSFSQLKEAALATLRIQLMALEHGMSLKDSSAFNIQFLGHRAILIDTLSFERYADGEPWVAYRQFCQHFLARFFSELCSWLIVEFVPKEDPQTQMLLASRVDIFEEYDRDHFERAFGEGFEIREAAAIPDSPRRMYLMRKRMMEEGPSRRRSLRPRIDG